MAQNLNGKTAIVTGAGSGINFCFARLLLSRGVNVLVADLALRPEAKELIDTHSKDSPRAVYLKTDVTSWLDLSRTFKVAHDEFGGVDIVCPGAGIPEPPSSNFWRPPGQPPSQDDPQSNHYACLDINITHPICVTQLAISYFLSAKPKVSPTNPKSIIHISSIARVHGLCSRARMPQNSLILINTKIDPTPYLAEPYPISVGSNVHLISILRC
ncbi:hypothetical protein GJ744_004191 [Endocarpon pusillum]|uniref:Uncharacterized protein n=1 Tax=Endocarpon pusillum TaxID=364733 RepID=A0A8H7DXQ7_9EURO|nr:hypothetical protein GJ744_004191 [Endocarpon pusillum]